MRLILSILTLSGALTVIHAAEFPEPDKLPVHKELPDPLVMLDGTKIQSAAAWKYKRRPELRRLVQHYMYGYLPGPAKVSAKIEREDAKALDGKATLREITLS